MKLSQLAVGQRGVIADLVGDSALIQRLLELGLTDGETVEVVRFAPLGDPMEIRVRGYYLSLRRVEAQAIELETLP
jgi:Fe2+ transport system protein FeoA